MMDLQWLEEFYIYVYRFIKRYVLYEITVFYLIKKGNIFNKYIFKAKYMLLRIFLNQ